MLTLEARNIYSLYSLAFFRFCFGLLMCIALIRFYAKGWIEDFYLAPRYFFAYYGFEWLAPPSSPVVLYSLYLLLFVLAVCIMLGWLFKPAIVGFFLLFTCTELWDKAVYLNHYYLISLLSFLMAFLPMNAVAALDCHLRRRPFTIRPGFVPHELLLKIQIGSVYFFGGIAKLGHDWLILGQPLKIWLSSNSAIPFVGPLLTLPAVAVVTAWFALLFDLSAPFLLYFGKTRPWIYGVVVLFHSLTAFLFPIGMFPWFMCVFTLVFFPGHWHKQFMTKLFSSQNGNLNLRHDSPAPRTGWVTGAFFLAQLLLPFRAWLYPGNPLWHEQGFRFSWRIMLMEKNGAVEYTVKVKQTGNEFVVSPAEFLTPRQVAQMSFQPDMILQFAHYLHGYFVQKGLGETEIRATAYASLNGKASQLLIDPETDLAVQRSGWQHKSWITEGPE